MRGIEIGLAGIRIVMKMLELYSEWRTDFSNDMKIEGELGKLC